MTEPSWDPVVIPAQLDDTQELDLADFDEPDPEDTEPTDPGPSPYVADPDAAAGPQDEAPDA